MALSDPTQIHFSRNHTPPGHYRVHRSGLFVVCELNKTKKILRRAAIDGYYYMKEGYIAGVPGEMVWGAKRTWRDVFYTDPDGGFSWDTEGILDYDNRAIRNWFNVIYFPAKVAEHPATMYIDTPLDKDGNVFQAGKTYKLTVPKDVPVDKFW
jgi:hypothetical protein